MWEIPVKYRTRCFSTEDGREIQHLDIEAINDKEAESRAFLNCVKSNDSDMNIRIEIERM